MKFGFIGLGLIGGSIALTIRQKMPDSKIIAYNRSEAPLRQALENGTIDHGTHSIDDSFAGCDFIFLCAPVNTNISFLPELKKYITDNTILTDVGSVKGIIHKAIEKELPYVHFIGGHPMAGSEKSGFENANDHLIENAYYILTPSPAASKRDIEKYEKLITDLGAIALTITPQKHDLITAAVSHVPHLIAYALVELIKETDTPEQYMKMIAAGGFKDITRIASSDPTMCEQICLENSDNILHVLEQYTKRLNGMSELVKGSNGQSLNKLFGDIKNYRDSLQDGVRGSISRSYDLHCDLIDETGAIATIATILSTKGISIKNIGIIHNRAYEQGALRIEFYDDASRSHASDTLIKHGYTIYQN